MVSVFHVSESDAYPIIVVTFGQVLNRSMLDAAKLPKKIII